MKGDTRYVVRGAVVGAIVGAVAGLLLSSLADEDTRRPGELRPMDTSRVFRLGVGVLGLIRQLVEL